MKYGIPTVKIQVTREGPVLGPDVSSPKEAVKIAGEILATLQTDRENLFTLLLDTKNKLIGWNHASMGTVNASLVNVAQVLRPVILSGAAAFVMCHNHPSGDPSPSEQDIFVTKKVVKATNIFDIKMLDHLIIGTPDRWVSLKDEGVI